eukprot:TRINITY_DN9517_c0_g2_i1.p1 TRINITY_DN9517_c0_g2~~TRINITY_DN9517_c0_g2_i1.p1  ORF type:complete len:269 (-),score=44.19 TRINITY_DN9517_c0_g2_i1:91-897(-)
MYGEDALSAKTEEDKVEVHESKNEVEEEDEEEKDANPWTAEAFEEPDNEMNLLLDDLGKIKAASVPKLITKITLSTTDPSFLLEFLLTYRSFIPSGLHLFAGLKARDSFATGEDARVIRLRVFNVLKIWVDKFWYDFVKDCPQLSELVVSWLDSIINDPNAGGGAHVVPTDFTTGAKVAHSIKTKLLGQLNLPSHRRRPIQTAVEEERRVLTIKDINCDIFEHSPDDIAKQLTLMEWKMWVAIKPYEFLDLAWAKKDKAARAGNGWKT